MRFSTPDVANGTRSKPSLLARTRKENWKSSSQLGIATALAGVDRFFMNGSGTRDTVIVMSRIEGSHQ